MNPIDPTCCEDAENMDKDRDKRWIDCSDDQNHHAGCCVKQLLMEAQHSEKNYLDSGNSFSFVQQSKLTPHKMLCEIH